MSGFSSLLNQFKQTTQQAAASSSSSSRGGGSSTAAASRGGGAADTDTAAKKRPRSIFESSNNPSISITGSKPKHDHPLQHTSYHAQQQNQQQRYGYPSTPVQTIYIACPAFAETGGPEALHQLCHQINTGEYCCYDDDSSSLALVDDDGDDDNGIVAGAAPEYDEFGRAISSNNNKKKDRDDGGKEDGAGKNRKKKNGVKAYMLYLRERGNTNAVEHIQSARARSFKYDRYNAPPAQSLPGDSGMMEQYYLQKSNTNSSNNSNEKKRGQEEEYSSELVIWPECWTHLIDSLQPEDDSVSGAKKYQIAIWWLSVNNNKGRFLPHQFAIRRDILHLVQSAYARDYVLSKLNRGGNGVGAKKKEGGEKDNDGRGGSNVTMLTEFIPYSSPTFSPKLFTEAPSSAQEEGNRDLDVVYNTAKGMHYTDEIIRRACGKKAKTNSDGSVSGGGIKFNPIGKGAGGRERMTGEEVVALLKRSKVYIDFGPHPGMDRLPREAALAGCVVITNREGAANFNEDVPLPSEFKFASFDVDKINSILKDCCNKHGVYAKKMEPYKKWILGQEKQMEVCVDRFVDKVVTRRIAKNSRDNQ
ncbi:hypothetical protein ACHAXR_007818 [Thalassiosira sp. AJA248-18]